MGGWWYRGNECAVWLWSRRWNNCENNLPMKCWCVCMSQWLLKNLCVRKWACASFSFQAYMHKKTAFSNPCTYFHICNIPNSLLFLCSFLHLLLESTGAPEYQWELLSVMPPPRGSAMNDWLWLPLTAGYTWPMDSLCRPMWISSSSSSVVLR